MEILLDHFPVFEANQVLMSGHLNDAFAYLDQQERQTRSHLIGIGIACGLRIELSGPAIALSTGCGVTSQGYLVVEPKDVSLTAYRSYTPPPDIDYPPFKSGSSTFALWELFEAGVSNTTPLDSPAGFLDDKAVVLFLELKKEGLRTCSPNNCDDKGSQVTATVRRLLIARSDLDKVIAGAAGLDSGLSESDLAARLSERLNLPDLRLRRFDVINSNPVTSNDVYVAFLDMIRTGGLAQATGKAMSAAYAAFRPLLADYPDDPFTGFAAAYGSLDQAPADTRMVKFLQYYAGLFDDLLGAYDEFRWKGLELMCACCPDDGLFPRHLMLGLLHPEKAANPAGYRQEFLPSPAVGACEEDGATVRQLFARLVAMCVGFTSQPELPKPNPALPYDPQIRVTPSRHCCGEGELEGQAIPYYYAQQGAQPLYRLWSPVNTRRRRENRNLGYHADLYDPAAPDFVTDPLRYDLGSHDFLRIEGHLGKDYQAVLHSLLRLKADYRLPIDVIALRTGAYDDSQPVDLSKEQVRFQDLEALYDSLRGALRSQLAEGILQLYGRSIPPIDGLTLNAGVPQLPLLQQYAPRFGYAANTIGAWYEHYLAHFQGQGYIDVDQNAINTSAMFWLYCALFYGTERPDPSAHPHVVAIYYFSKLAEILTPTLAALDYADFENKYQDLMSLIRFLRSSAASTIPADLKSFLPQDEFMDLCEGVLLGCKLDAVKAVRDQFQARVGELRRLQLLSSFLQREPGIQHKAGVPLGGTFILVHHGAAATRKFDFAANPGLLEAALERDNVRLSDLAGTLRTAARSAGSDIAEPGNPSRLARAIGNLSANRNLLQNEDLSVVVDWLAGRAPVAALGGDVRFAGDPAAGVIGKAVGELEAGTVIADFFLPYRVSGGGPGIEYVLPKVPPTFTSAVGCTAPDGHAAVTIDTKGGVPPYDVAVDGGAWQALAGPLSLAAGDHGIMLRDAAGAETPARSITVAPALAIGEPTFSCTEGKYTATASISGGTPPYEVNGQPAPTAMVVTSPVPSGTPVAVTVRDSKGCALATEFNHECCTLPCTGASLNRNFRFFLPEPDGNPDNGYRAFEVRELKFTIQSEYATGSTPETWVDLTDKVKPILKATPDQLVANRFQKTVSGWLASINKLIANTPGLAQPDKAQWLTLGYKSQGPGRFGVLTIEYFQCLKFDIHLLVGWAQANVEQTMGFAYLPGGTSIEMRTGSVSVPAFDGTSIDKCSDGPKPMNLCPLPPEFSVQVEGPDAMAVGRPGRFAVNVSPPQQNMNFVWEAQDGAPALGNGQKFETVFASAGDKLVTVTAFNAQGCSVSATVRVQVRGDR
jgi:hypothetical protein